MTAKVVPQQWWSEPIFRRIGALGVLKVASGGFNLGMWKG